MQRGRKNKVLRGFVHQVRAGRALKRSGDLVQRERKNKGLRGFVHQPRAEKTGKGGPGTAQVGAPLPAKPCASVARRQHFALECGPAAGRVGAPLPAKPCASVARRQHFAWSAAVHRPSWRLGAGKTLCLRYGAPTFYPEARPAAGKVRARFPAKPINSVFVREPRWLRRAESRSGRRFGSRSAARKANKFGFCARTPVPRRAESRPAGRHLQLIRRPPKNNKKTSNLSCSSMVRDQGFEPWTP